MPTLADIYSAINTAKRKGGDFVRNPGTSLQQMLGNANDQARGFNQLNDQALAEMEQTGQLTGPAGQQLMQTMGQAYSPVGMVSNTLAAKYPNVALDVFESPKAIDLSRIVVPKEMRGQGVGSSVMQDLIDYADETGKQVRLTPSDAFGGNTARLKKFYKEFGFVENKGKNKDFTTMESMIRSPQLQQVEDYGMAHRPMTVQQGAAPLHDLSSAFDDTIYGKAGLQNYGTGSPRLDQEALKVFSKVKGNPNAEVTIYRAIPKGEKASKINAGDWVTVSKEYAMEHGEGALGGKYKIISQKVPASHVTTNADSILEQGYYPQ